MATIPIVRDGDDGTKFKNFFGTDTWSPLFCQVGWNAISEREAGVALLFENVNIAQGSNIGSATLTVTAFGNEAGVIVRSRISAHDVDNGVFVATAAEYVAKYAARTTARVDWDNIVAFVADTEYTSPDFRSVIQEIVDRPGWVSGNDILIFWDDTEARSTPVFGTNRVIYDYRQSAVKAAELNVIEDRGQIVALNIV